MIPAALVLAFATLVAFNGQVSAESPADVVEELAVDGVFVAEGRTDIDEAAVAAAIDEARAFGLRLVAVAPNDPQPDAAAFARRVQEASDADAAVVFPPGGGFEAHVIEEYNSAGLRAIEVGRSKATPVAAVEAFSAELLVEPERGVPPIVRQVMLVVFFMAILLAGAVAGEQYLRRTGGSGTAGRAKLDELLAMVRRT